jgi:hypothetical protein
MYPVKPKESEIFNELENLPWFENIGKDLVLEKDIQEMSVQCESLDKALESMLSIDWANFKLNKRNDIGEYLSVNFRERFNKWNDVVYSFEPGLNHVIATISERFEVFGDKKVEVMKKVKLDFIYFCTTGEYQDLVDVEFFIFLTYWYSIGKLPCGWVGDSINGKILVY